MHNHQYDGDDRDYDHIRSLVHGGREYSRRILYAHYNVHGNARGQLHNYNYGHDDECGCGNVRGAHSHNYTFPSFLFQS